MIHVIGSNIWECNLDFELCKPRSESIAVNFVWSQVKSSEVRIKKLTYILKQNVFIVLWYRSMPCVISSSCKYNIPEGNWNICIIGTVLTLAGIILSAFATKIWHLVLSHSIVSCELVSISVSGCQCMHILLRCMNMQYFRISRRKEESIQLRLILFYHRPAALSNIVRHFCWKSL